MNTAKRILFGTALGLAVGVAIGVIVHFVEEWFWATRPSWGVILLLAGTGALAGSLVAWRAEPANLLDRLADKLPDEFVFPAFVLVLFAGVLLAILKAPDSYGLQKVFPESDKHGLNVASAGQEKFPMVTILAISLDGIVTCLALLLVWLCWRPRVHGVRLNNREFEAAAWKGAEKWALIFYTEFKANKLTSGKIAEKYQWCRESVESMIAYQEAQMGP